VAVLVAAVSAEVQEVEALEVAAVLVVASAVAVLAAVALLEVGRSLYHPMLQNLLS